MKETLLKASSVIMVFVFGCLFGAHALWLNLRMNALEQRQANFEQGVEGFAKQVNDKLNPKPVAPAPAPDKQLPGDPSKR